MSRTQGLRDHCYIKCPFLGLGACFGQFSSNDISFHHELMFAMALDFQIVSRKIPQIKTNINLFFIFGAWKSIHQNINKICVLLILAEVDYLQVSIKVTLCNKFPSCHKNKACNMGRIWNFIECCFLCLVGIPSKLVCIPSTFLTI